MDIDRNHNDLYTHSFLYFGRDQAFLQLQDGLEKAGRGENPCYPKGEKDSRGLTGSSNSSACADACSISSSPLRRASI